VQSSAFHQILDTEGECGVDDDSTEETAFNSQKGVFMFPPTLEEAEAAFMDITKILKPPQMKAEAINLANWMMLLGHVSMGSKCF